LILATAAVSTFSRGIWAKAQPDTNERSTMILVIVRFMCAVPPEVSKLGGNGSPVIPFIVLAE
jgi:hypothetical protein